MQIESIAICQRHVNKLDAVDIVKHDDFGVV